MESLPGITQWFPFENRGLVERSLVALSDLRVRRLRTLVSWADWTRPDGIAWYDWLMGRLATVPELEFLPSLFYTPPSIARADADSNRRTSYPPEVLSSFAGFVEEVIERFGHRFLWIQLWNEPNWEPYWSSRMDPDGTLFAQMAGEAADAAHARGKSVALGGTTPLDYPWFVRMDELGLIEKCDAIAFHNSPSWRNQHRTWYPLLTELRAIRALLKGLGRTPQVWMDESGFATRTHADEDERRLEREQVEYFDMMRSLPADRVYWYSLVDQADDHPTDDELNAGTDRDPTAYHFGMVRQDGTEKPLYRHWRELADLAHAEA